MRHRLAILPITFSVSLLFPISSVVALPTRTVFASEAQGAKGSTVALEVSPGHGLNINFIPTGETIRKAWIDDPSQIALSFDGDLCQWSGNQEQQCTNTGASVIHLRQIKPIKFPNLPRSSNGSTLLTVITEGALGPKLYQFQIDPASGNPQYTALNIRPDSEESTPVANQLLINTSDTERTGSTESGGFNYPTASRDSPQDNVREPQPSTDAINEPQPSNTSLALSQTVPILKDYTEQPFNTAVSKTPGEPGHFSNNPTSQDSLQNNIREPQPTTNTDPTLYEPAGTKPTLSESTHYSQQIINEVNAAPSLVLGLLVARQRGEISPNTPEWLEAQTAHSWLLRGKTIEEAASRAEMPLSTLSQLIQWGQGSLQTD